jgi:hypothetical protein
VPLVLQLTTCATRRRVPLRLLLRAPGIELSALGGRFQGYRVVILGFARPEDWDGIWRDGDIEGFVWLSPSLQLGDAIDDLRGFSDVVDVRISPRDGG